MRRTSLAVCTLCGCKEQKRLGPLPLQLQAVISPGNSSENEVRVSARAVNALIL